MCRRPERKASSRASCGCERLDSARRRFRWAQCIVEGLGYVALPECLASATGGHRSRQILRALAKARAERDNPALNNPGSHQATGSALGTSHSGIAVAGEDRGVWGAEQNALRRLPLFNGLFVCRTGTRGSRTQGRSTLTKFACVEMKGVDGMQSLASLA